MQYGRDATTSSLREGYRGARRGHGRHPQLVVLRQLSIDAIMLRFRRTRLGWPWLIIRPALGATGVTFLFSGVLELTTSGNVPYLLFFSGGQALWNLLDLGLNLTTRSLEATRGIREAAAVRRSTAVTAFLAPAWLEFGIILLLTMLYACYYRIDHGVWYIQWRPQLLLLVPAVALISLLVLGIGTCMAILGQTYRDARWGLRYLVGPWLYVTPVLYAAQEVPDALRWTLPVNPAALPVLLAREALFGGAGLNRSIITGGIVGVLLVCLLGLASSAASDRARAARISSIRVEPAGSAP